MSFSLSIIYIYIYIFCTYYDTDITLMLQQAVPSPRFASCGQSPMKDKSSRKRLWSSVSTLKYFERPGRWSWSSFPFLVSGPHCYSRRNADKQHLIRMRRQVTTGCRKCNVHLYVYTSAVHRQTDRPRDRPTDRPTD